MPVVIFVTAHDRFALQAFEAEAARLSAETLRRGAGPQGAGACARFPRRRRAPRARAAVRRAAARHRGARDDTCVLVKKRERVIVLRPEEIDFIEAYGDYVRLRVGSRIAPAARHAQRHGAQAQGRGLRAHPPLAAGELAARAGIHRRSRSRSGRGAQERRCVSTPVLPTSRICSSGSTRRLTRALRSSRGFAGFVARGAALRRKPLSRPVHGSAQCAPMKTPTLMLGRDLLHLDARLCWHRRRSATRRRACDPSQRNRRPS